MSIKVSHQSHRPVDRQPPPRRMGEIDPYAQVPTMRTYPEIDGATLDSVRLRAKVDFT